jgi:hypothetical protein
MLDSIREKIRALVVDTEKSGFQTFVYKTTPIFTIAQPNVEIAKVLLNGVETADYEFDVVTNKIEITSSALTTSDVIEVDYTYTKYSDTELDGYIRSALVFISVHCYDDKDYELEYESGNVGNIVPTPDNRTTDLVALVASILIKPGYSQYNLPNLKVVYPEKMTKEERIEKLISKFQTGLGANYIINFDILPNM